MNASLQLLGHGRRQRLALPLFEFGLRIEEIDLAGRALHEHEDDVLGFGREVRRFGRQRIGSLRAAAARSVSNLRQRDDAEAARAVAQEESRRL